MRGKKLFNSAGFNVILKKINRWENHGMLNYWFSIKKINTNLLGTDKKTGHLSALVLKKKEKKGDDKKFWVVKLFTFNWLI